MNLRSWLEQGPFTLAMSAGFFGFYSHCGFIKALHEEGFKPEKVMGASAGALVGSLLCSDITPSEIEKVLKSTTKEHFWDFKPGLGLLAGKKFQELLRQHLPENFEDLSVPLSVSTFNLKNLKTQVFYSGHLVEPVRASCCFPLLFQPVRWQNYFLFDGGISDWLGIAGPHYNERTLIHFLSPEGFGQSYIKRRSEKKIQKTNFVFRLPEPMRMGPNLMHQAADAISAAYFQTKEALKQR